MSEIKIEKGIPIPASHLKYPFHKMGIGDSFVCQSTNGIYNLARRAGISIRVKTLSIGGYRVWRIK